ncbi:MAG: hypothetical protein K6T29_10770 [Peptococcaceae bacterium]|nr:hypothetical protein [Peptococcaceae bacterium]
MLVATNTVLAMRCPECGKMDFHDISRFALARGKTVQINCSCGAAKLIAATRDRSTYRLHIPCVVCEVGHLREVAGRVLWSEEVTCLSCQETDLVLGYIGPEQKVREMAFNHEQELEALVREFGCDGYFHNSEVMYEVLNCLHDIAEQGSLYCQCGNHKIEVDIFPDRLELQCRECDSVNIIYAETEEDLQVIQQVDAIELARHGFNCLDSLASTGRLKKHRRRRSKT